MRLLLVRHGQTPANVDGLLNTAIPGPGLTALGEQQAAMIPVGLRGTPVDAVYASLLVRTQLTARPLAEDRGLDVRVLEGIHEIGAGALEDLRDRASVRAYLETSVPDSGELDDFFVLFTCYQALRAAGVHDDPAFEAFIADLGRDLTAKLGDPFRALVVRLVGDGLLLNAVMGTPVPDDQRDALIEHFSAGPEGPSAAPPTESTS